MPASSAAIERIFSNFGLIQTKLRNKLKIQKCGKLVFCYLINVKGKDELGWEMVVLHVQSMKNYVFIITGNNGE